LAEKTAEGRWDAPLAGKLPHRIYHLSNAVKDAAGLYI